MNDRIIFKSATEYIESCTTLDARIAAIDAIINQLFLSAAKSAESGHLMEYWFDDGHVKIRNVYRSVMDMEKSITSFQRLRELYVNKKFGRGFKLMDSGNFTPRSW